MTEATPLHRDRIPSVEAEMDRTCCIRVVGVVEDKVEEAEERAAEGERICIRVLILSTG